MCDLRQRQQLYFLHKRDQIPDIGGSLQVLFGLLRAIVLGVHVPVPIMHGRGRQLRDLQWPGLPILHVEQCDWQG